MKHSKGDISIRNFWLTLINQSAKANLGSKEAFPKGLQWLALGLHDFRIFLAQRNECTIQARRNYHGWPIIVQASQEEGHPSWTVFQSVCGLSPPSSVMMQKCKTGREGLHPRKLQRAKLEYPCKTPPKKWWWTGQFVSEQAHKTNALMTLQTITFTIYLALALYQSQHEKFYMHDFIFLAQQHHDVDVISLLTSESRRLRFREKNSCTQGHSASHWNSNVCMSEPREQVMFWRISDGKSHEG